MLTDSVQKPTNTNMANRKFTEQGIPQEVRRPEISTSEKIWQAFDKWAAERGYPSLSEAFRAAMIEVTGLNPESQEKSGQLKVS